MPGFTVRVDPTLGVPVIVGVDLTSAPLMTTAVGRDVLESGA